MNKVSITFNGEEVAIYVDGVLDVKSKTTTPGFYFGRFSDLKTADNDTIFIGRSIGGALEQFQGEIFGISVS